MAFVSAAEFREIVMPGLVAHIDRYENDQAYRKRVDEEGARSEKAYREHVAMLDALVAAGKTWPP